MPGFQQETPTARRARCYRDGYADRLVGLPKTNATLSDEPKDYRLGWEAAEREQAAAAKNELQALREKIDNHIAFGEHGEALQLLVAHVFGSK